EVFLIKIYTWFSATAGQKTFFIVRKWSNWNEIIPNLNLFLYCHVITKDGQAVKVMYMPFTKKFLLTNVRLNSTYAAGLICLKKHANALKLWVMIKSQLSLNFTTRLIFNHYPILRQILHLYC